jgi:hypothetical protein
VGEYLCFRLGATRETELNDHAFPGDCPQMVEQILDENIWPEQAAPQQENAH